jgi:phospholipid transport system substrate-binding protein
MKLFQMIAMSVAVAVTAPAAFADRKAEQYVETNANAVLQLLNDRSLTADGRRQRFNEQMHRFANVRGIARRVLGQYGRNYPDGNAQFETYYTRFEVYALSVYEVQLDQFRGESIRVTGSTDLDSRRSQVSTMIRNSSTGRNTKVVWDVLMSADGQNYRVRDVGIDLGGAVLWLAQDQQAQFESFLDRTTPPGQLPPLVTRINTMIADMDTRRRAGAAPTIQNRRPSGGGE